MAFVGRTRLCHNRNIDKNRFRHKPVCPKVDNIEDLYELDEPKLYFFVTNRNVAQKWIFFLFYSKINLSKNQNFEKNAIFSQNLKFRSTLLLK